MSHGYECLTSAQVSRFLDLWSLHLRGKLRFRLIQAYLRAVGCPAKGRGDVAALIVGLASRHRSRSVDC